LKNEMLLPRVSRLKKPLQYELDNAKSLHESKTTVPPASQEVDSDCLHACRVACGGHGYRHTGGHIVTGAVKGKTDGEEDFMPQ
jgi:hypothetical protein